MDRLITKNVNGTIRLSSLRLPEKSKWVVWWYGPVIKRVRRGEQPGVAVFFRGLNRDDSISEVYQERICPLTDLTLIKLGSVWENNICIAQVVFEQRVFDVDFSYRNGGWKIITLGSEKKFKSPLYNMCSDLYMTNVDDNSCLLKFGLINGGHLVIPSLEFYLRCYGESGELKRTLLTYSWDEICERLYAVAEYQGKNVLYVKLRKRMHNGDAAFIAFFALDNFTQTVIKRIISQLMCESDVSVHLKVAPWFRGKAKLKVKGISFDSGNSFLGFEVTGCSLPDGYTVKHDRDNTNFVKDPADDDGKKAWDNVAARKRYSADLPLDIDNAFEPDPGASPVEIATESFEVLGDGCSVVSLRKRKAESVSGEKSENRLHSYYSESESVEGRNANDVGYLSVNSENKPAELLLESHGVVRDMWNAILYLRSEYPDKVTAVEWYTPETSYSCAMEPRLVAVPEFDNQCVTDDAAKISRTILNWPYLNVMSKKDIRGILVVRVNFDGNIVHLVEIQRRLTHEGISDSISEDEKFRGLVFKLDDADDIFNWVSLLVHELRYVKGIIQKLSSKCPGVALPYKHSSAKNEPVPCYSALINAVGKLGVILW